LADSLLRRNAEAQKSEPQRDEVSATNRISWVAKMYPIYGGFDDSDLWS